MKTTEVLEAVFTSQDHTKDPALRSDKDVSAILLSDGSLFVISPKIGVELADKDLLDRHKERQFTIPNSNLRVGAQYSIICLYKRKVIKK